MCQQCPRLKTNLCRSLFGTKRSAQQGGLFAVGREAQRVADIVDGSRKILFGSSNAFRQQSRPCSGSNSKPPGYVRGP